MDDEQQLMDNVCAGKPFYLISSLSIGAELKQLSFNDALVNITKDFSSWGYKVNDRWTSCEMLILSGQKRIKNKVYFYRRQQQLLSSRTTNKYITSAL